MTEVVVTQEDVLLVDAISVEMDAYREAWFAPDKERALDHYEKAKQLAARHRTQAQAAGPVLHPFEALQHAIHADPEYAWALHCNLAMPICDAIGVDHKRANEAAAHLMSFLFSYDIATHPNYAYEKPLAQSYHEMRMGMDADEDTAITQTEGRQP